MLTQYDKVQIFRSLHVAGRPLVLFNIWDAGSAKAVAEAGAAALATGSWSVAAAQGYADGEQIPLDAALANLRRIVAQTALPVSVDLESGYGEAPADVGNTVAAVIEAGAVGCNLEDSFVADGSLRPLADAAARLAQARAAADRSRVACFVNARCDLFLRNPAAVHDAALIDAALQRARAYADAGADGLFVPGLVDTALIARLAAQSPLPVNVMIGPGAASLDALAAAGVARISYGPGPYREAMSAVREAAAAIYGASGSGI
ncbi:MAG: isocitrate lyase/phosphoenolpyruvate mutase family protein [Rhodanobacteraceae bacterium]|nr:isocitrate lyase/phosphoenolpyruvate mutase family protein [Rhodanobacteraceae bacterium]